MNKNIFGQYSNIANETKLAGLQAEEAAWQWNAGKMRKKAQEILALADQMERLNRNAMVESICSAVE